ncbi:MAG TPA: acyl-CoA desaturase [Dehalococcoidia bacterium]|nr:acyl-CoA desaturase [Dehalococcoidia bacterium]
MRSSLPPSHAAAPPVPLSAVGQYAELKRRVKVAGLLKPQPRYYAWKFATTALLATMALLLLSTSRNPWWLVFDAALLAAVFVQFAFLGHDVGHRQVVRSQRPRTVLSLIVGNLLVGVSASWWQTKHNRHHGHPNRPGFDPDVMLPVLAFSPERAQSMNRAQRLFVRYQHLLFLALVLTEGIVLRVSSIEYLVTRRGRCWLLELLLIVLHLAAYSELAIHHFGVMPGLGFIALHQMCFGLYMGLVFAPNHKGMATNAAPPADVADDFLLEQVLSSRNVQPSPLLDYLFGGLNYQIEHHLFPTLPRNRLPAAQALVETFCAEYGIPYHQTSPLTAYRDIFGHLRSVGQAARGAPPSPVAGRQQEGAVQP